MRHLAFQAAHRFTVAVPAERFILIPGMGADERLFGPQRAYGFTFETFRLPIPEPQDDLPAYAARIKAMLDLTGPCVVGGVSFGGMVACELATICQARCAILIASCRDNSAIPQYYWWVDRMARIFPDFLIRHRCGASSRIMAKLEFLTDEQRELIRAMAGDIPVPFLRGAGRLILNWAGRRELPRPTYHIHGEIDRIIPLKGVQPDEVVARGGHLINLTHAEQVNRFIERCLFSNSFRA
ncbi:MAG TPA: alpha/beta hydrolase [Phycisphaerae bacterium]|nr:alpha/beta hydrolase [Phycisphaerae bacterium]